MKLALIGFGSLFIMWFLFIFIITMWDDGGIWLTFTDALKSAAGQIAIAVACLGVAWLMG